MATITTAILPTVRAGSGAHLAPAIRVGSVGGAGVSGVEPLEVGHRDGNGG